MASVDAVLPLGKALDGRCHRFPSLYEGSARKPMPNTPAGLPDPLDPPRAWAPRAQARASDQAARAQSTRVRNAIASFITRTSSIGLRPKNRLNSRLNCEGLS